MKLETFVIVSEDETEIKQVQPATYWLKGHPFNPTPYTLTGDSQELLKKAVINVAAAILFHTNQDPSPENVQKLISSLK